jgi:protein required for attachment to host cells
MQYPHGTTIAVTDGQRLRVFRNTGNQQQLRLMELPKPDAQAHLHGATRAHHTIGANESERHLEEDSHASATAAWLNAQVLNGQIEHLFVVAPARTLGELRRHYHPKLQAKLIGELNKEHTHDTPEFLQEALLRV